jgi:hypothetical protein
MNKRTIIIITIITTILSLVFTLFSYFEITRYISLHCQPVEPFIKNYSKLPKASKNRVIISFSTTPDKVEKLKPMINSILDQTVKVDMITIIIPLEYKGKKYNLPKYIQDVAVVLPSGKDYGKGTKLIPLLLKEKESDTIIIAIDDDRVYGKDFIETMVEEANKNPNTVLIDKKNVAILTRPECFGCDVIDRTKKDFDIEWFLNKAHKTKVVDYNQNYKCW